MSLTALAGADENSPRLDLEGVVRLLCRKAEIEWRVGCRPSGLCKEGRRWGDGGRLHGGEIERVRVRKVGRLRGVIVVGRRRRKLPGGAVPWRLLTLWRARLALDGGVRV